MEDANVTVARAICEELARLGLVSKSRVKRLEQSICEGNTTGVMWSFEIEASLPTKSGQTDVE